MTEPRPALLEEQMAYYRARAAEYDEWWQRTGRYDRGAEPTRRWNTEVASVEAALGAAALTGDVLEVACGTGWWTQRLARSARQLTCIDASPETLDLNRERIARAGLALPRYEIADLFDWTPAATYDAVFFSFWLSHVPEDRFTAFWERVAAALKPGGRAYLIDSLPDPTSTASNHHAPDADGIQERRLNDGRSFRIVKIFRGPEELNRRLESLGWQPDMRSTERYFVYGAATRA
ncbi:class I SAM-dependent methyltransferase [Piscinibacter koreensis]|uniref:Class I SAM-dependent methyltransferase n=1 Tax=Piscinibacter koreensis TaxID=2742824 RepID=A0A7Y6NJE3_9BURK|nr:class I SAM-dependent methyltransferase [Schlegelella koreensis]NUZ04285.1 class I SAM-dependent methyltransferase [Schlegelella koreensis]